MHQKQHLFCDVLFKFQGANLQKRYNVELLVFVGFSSPTVNGKGILTLFYKGQKTNDEYSPLHHRL